MSTEHKEKLLVAINAALQCDSDSLLIALNTMYRHILRSKTMHLLNETEFREVNEAHRYALNQLPIQE